MARQPRKLPIGIFARQRKYGLVYYICFMFERKQVQEQAGTDLRMAKRLLAQRKREVSAGTYCRGVVGSCVTLNDYVPGFLQDRQKRELRTVDDDETRLRLHVQPVLGHCPLGEIRPKQVRDFVLDLRREAKIAPKSILNVHGILHTLLEAARFDELISHNPAHKLPPGTLPLNEKMKDTEPYSRDEAECLASDQRVPRDRRIIYMMMHLMGTRLGETVGRRWRDHDTSTKPLELMDVATQYDGLPLKTGKPRQVPVHPVLAQELAEWKVNGWPKFFGREPRPDDFIVPKRKGGCRTKSASGKAMRRDCDLIGVPNKGTHGCRRFFITYARADGARQEIIERITHNAKGTMVDRYTYFGLETLCEAVLCLRFELRSHRGVQRPKSAAPNEAGRSPVDPVYDASYDAKTEPAEIIPQIGGGAGSRIQVPFTIRLNLRGSD